MSSDMDDLQEMILGDMKRMYSEEVIEHAMHPRNVGSISDPDGFALITGPCGDTMQIWLKIRDNRIAEASFWTDGCSTSIASGSMTTELAKSKTIPEVLQINQEDILQALGGLPEDSEHCALLASNTLKEAVRDYLAMKKEPWKKAYRK